MNMMMNNTTEGGMPYKQQGDDFRPTFYNPFEIKHRKRTSRAQFKVLEKTFLENPKPNAAIRRWLAQKLSMTPRGVQVWFQNRRAKEKTTNIIEPVKAEPIQVHESTPPASPVKNEYPSPCSCTDCHLFNTTPMTRTLSYPLYSDCDEEEQLLMTPVFQQQPLYDVFKEWEEQETLNYFNQMMDNRRYSAPIMMAPPPPPPQQDFYRRLSEPIFEQQQYQPMFDPQFEFMETARSRYSF